MPQSYNFFRRNEIKPHWFFTCFGQRDVFQMEKGGGMFWLLRKGSMVIDGQWLASVWLEILFH